MKWEKYVGRRQPPLRGELAFKGTIKWFKDNGFGNCSDLYIFFSTLTKKGIISDHYINIKLRKKIVDKFKAKILHDINYAYHILEDFDEKAKNLKDFSIKLNKKINIKEIFTKFCTVWENFGPNLYVFLLLIEATEDIVLNDFPNKRTQLMEQIASKVESEFFQTKNKKQDINYFPEKYQKYIKLLTEMMEYRDKRKVIYDKSWYEYSSKFFKVLEEKYGNKLYFMGKNDILNDKKKEIQMPTLVYAKNENIFIKYGEQVQQIKEEILKPIKSKNSVSGTVANPGEARGKVRIIEPHVENQIFEEGEILITRMTTPDLIPLIKKASAIVTDEGGLTCHAAIVSREFDVPCIIGTKIATQIFKDGDKVKIKQNKVEKINSTS